MKIKCRFLGQEVFVHGLTPDELSDLPTTAEVIQRAVRDEKNQLIFQEDDLEAIGNLPAQAISELMVLIGKIS